MSAKFYQRLIDKNKVPALGNRAFKSKFFIAAPGDFTIQATEKVAMSKWSCYGTNASFFMNQASGVGYMTALHIVNSETIAEATNNPKYVEGGGSNLSVWGNNNTAMDFLYYTGSSVGIKEKTAAWSKTNNAGISTIQWAVGGYNLLVSSSTNDEATWKSDFLSYYSNIGGANIPYTPKAARTLIGYRKNTNDVALVTVFGNVDSDLPKSAGPTYFESFLIMRYLGCSMALALDGSTCTKIRYKENGANKCIDSGRETWCRICLTDNAARNCDWTGT